ncbi:MAG: 16S rRNA (guanine(966)-N(2))-methyltransferase RsmD [Bacteroidales bacterium]|nr:16S rRNA (guanine(966)-N(2))-methyltransferase RsmD [Bacteroidales bacterium]
MRIIGGDHKGRRIHAPAGLPVRPTTDMAKEALFNILHNYYDFEGIKVLDLFAGIGSISYEFASRDAAEVHSVEMNPRCVNFITETSRKLDLKNLFVIRANVFTYLKRSGKKFDIIFADPPYDLEGIETIPDLVFENDLLDKEGWLIVEHSAGIDFSAHPNFDQNRKYGKVNFSMFSNK